jgi:hypothetical protein
MKTNNVSDMSDFSRVIHVQHPNFYPLFVGNGQAQLTHMMGFWCFVVAIVADQYSKTTSTATAPDGVIIKRNIAHGTVPNDLFVQGSSGHSIVKHKVFTLVTTVLAILFNVPMNTTRQLKDLLKSFSLRLQQRRGSFTAHTTGAVH